MQEPTLRHWHRAVGLALGPLLLLQAVSGLFLSVEILYGAHERVHSLLVGRRMPSVARFWDFLLVEIHYGGILGRWYHWGLGFGLAFLVASGSLIFIRLRARLRANVTGTGRLRPAAAVAVSGTADGAAQPATSLDRLYSLQWKVYALLGAGALAIFLAASFTHFRAYRLLSLNAPLVGAASEVKLGGALAHLWFEEIMVGDPHETLDTVWESLDAADGYARAMQQGGLTPRGILPPLTDAPTLKELAAVRGKLAELREITRARLRDPAGAGPGSPLDQRHDALFLDFLATAGAFDAAVQAAIRRDLAAFRNNLAVVVTTGLLLTAAIGFLVLRLERQRSQSVLAIESARAECEDSQAGMRDLISAVSDSVLLVDPEGRIVEANRSACRSLGYTEEELTGLPVGRVEAGLDEDDLVERLRRIEPGHPARVAGLHRRRDGSTFPVEWHLGAYERAGQRVAVCLARTLSEPSPERRPASPPSQSPGRKDRSRSDP
ncbi:MAG: PAS domain S-box protein [Deferrisomatales bacterium]|nr:PAS domain S-box protein [Deferrisomatales bacterium]